MSDDTPSFEDKTLMLREAYAALNRNDVAGFVKNFDTDIEWTDPAEGPGGATTYKGLAAVHEHAVQSREMWAKGTCEPEKFIDAGDKVVVFARVRVKLKNESEWREGSIGDVYTFRDEKIIQGRVFVDRKQALEWAEVSAAGGSLT